MSFSQTVLQGVADCSPSTATGKFATPIACGGCQWKFKVLTGVSTMSTVARMSLFLARHFVQSTAGMLKRRGSLVVYGSTWHPPKVIVIRCPGDVTNWPHGHF